MAFEIFNKELAALERANLVLEKNLIADPEAAGEFATLVKAYNKLLRSSKRLVRLADINEAELNSTARALDEKNAMLEALSSKLSRYLSPQVYEQIFQGGKDVELNTERKKLTVFFSDIQNFTQTSEDLQPEDLTYILNKYFTEMSAISLKYGATIDKFIGDAMLLFFGDPQTKGVQEDARLCVRMAIDMQRRMRDLQDIWYNKGYEQPFHMRVGINTGYCNVGNFGSEDRMDYTIIGGEVNLAARLESQADPDGILMSYETYALVKDIVDAEARPPIDAKGIRKEVKPYAVKGIFDSKNYKSQFIRAEEDGLSLVIDRERLKGKARDRAITKLRSAIDDLQPKKGKKS